MDKKFDELWSRWNSLRAEDRMMYIDHAYHLVERGYIILEEGDDPFELALRCYAAKLKNERKDKSP